MPVKKYNIIIWILFISILLCTGGGYPVENCSAMSKFYYLHVSSHKNKQGALKDVSRLKRLKIKAIAISETVPNKGRWYRVYIGPFLSRQEAVIYSQTLKKKRIIDYAAILEKYPLTETPVKETIVKEHIVKESVKATESPQYKKEITIPPEKESHVIKRTPPPVKTVDIRKSTPLKTVQKKAERGMGRNIKGMSIGIGARHTYLEIETKLEKRMLVTSDGLTISKTDVLLTGINTDDFSTSMHIDTLRLRCGITDYLELFFDSGVTWYDSSDVNPVYGAGARLNLIELNKMPFSGYFAIEGDCLLGEFEREYKSKNKNKWEKETEWEAFSGRGEFGITHRFFSLYLGGEYNFYKEDTERSLMNNIPAPFVSYTYQDELEGQEKAGPYGGITIFFSDSILLNIEGRALSKKGVSAALEYCF